MAKIFVSYSRSVKDEVGKIIALLEAGGHEVWWDGDIPVIADWWATILNYIEWGEVFVFVASEKSVHSAYCIAELKYAAERNRPIVPFILDGTPIDRLPDELPHRYQRLVYDGDPARMLSAINNAIGHIHWEQHRDLPAPRPPEPLTGGTSLAQQFQEARRLANDEQFEEAKRRLRNIKNLDYGEWGSECDEWLARLNSYAYIVELAADDSTLNRARAAWEQHGRTYGKHFDPHGIEVILRGTEAPAKRPAAVTVGIVLIVIVGVSGAVLLALSRSNPPATLESLPTTAVAAVSSQRLTPTPTSSVDPEVTISSALFIAEQDIVRLSLSAVGEDQIEKYQVEVIGPGGNPWQTIEHIAPVTVPIVFSVEGVPDGQITIIVRMIRPDGTPADDTERTVRIPRPTPTPTLTLTNTPSPTMTGTPEPISATIDGIRLDLETDAVIVNLFYLQRQEISRIRLSIFNNNTLVRVIEPTALDDQVTFAGRANGLEAGQTYTVRVQVLDEAGTVLNDTSTMEFKYTPVVTATPTPTITFTPSPVIVSAFIENVTFDVSQQHFIIRLAYENSNLIDRVEIYVLDRNNLLVEKISSNVAETIIFDPDLLVGQHQYRLVLRAFTAQGDLLVSAERQITDPRTPVPSPTPTGRPSRTPMLTPTDRTSTPEPLALTSVASNDDWTPVERDFDGVMMVLVPPGCFDMGSDDSDNEQPVEEFCFDKPYWIDKTEVTQAAYERLTGENPSCYVEDDHPVECINWFDARDFCWLRDAYLPTEFDWEYAARGPDGVTYPWGETFDEAEDEDKVVYAGNSEEHSVSAGSRPEGASWVGALDMSGNVWELTSSLFLEYPYGEDHERESDESLLRVMRGGSFWESPGNLTTTIRGEAYSDGDADDRGFRCARDYEE